ncbi:MAG TPA: type II secretion system F family protein, partial [Gaiellaceae bacterium]|nr:type II secretion system F family protein [Gaiellaceae bacterium]
QVFSRQFATLIQAGVSIVQALLILEEQTDDKKLAVVIAEVREDVESGVVLSRAMSRHPKVFSRLYVAMIEAGEASGTLDIVLDRVAIQIEKDTKLKRRVKSAMIYPTVVLTFAFLVLCGMLMFLVPIFVKIFAQLNGQLPTITQLVVNASNLLRDYYWIIFPAIFLIIFSLLRYKKTPQGRALWDRTKLRLPMKIGDVVLKVAMARFSRTLATLVSAGVDIVKALEITGSTAGNSVLEDSLVDIRRRVNEGARIAQTLQESAIFPPMVSQMVKIGEETGELDHMLSKIADFYEDEVDTAVAALTSIIEPIMMIGVGAMVGLIVISMYMPMFKMLKLVH